MKQILVIIVMVGLVMGASGLEMCRIPVVDGREQAPVIDGVIRGGEWQYALGLTGLISLEGPLAQRQATVYYLSDGDSLYVGMYAPAVPPGTAPEVKEGPAYSGRNYGDFTGNDRVEFKLSPPGAEQLGQFYFIGDAAGNTLVEQIKSEHVTIFPDWDYKSSHDGNGWTVEIRLPLAVFGVTPTAALDGSWGINFSLARLFPLKYEGLAAGGPHALRPAIFTRGAPAVQIERLGNLPQGLVDLVVSVREYEGLVATPKEGAYDERKVESGGMSLQGSGRIARVSWQIADGGGELLASDATYLPLQPARSLTAAFNKSFKPAGANTMTLKVEVAESAEIFTANDIDRIELLYSGILPFVPFNEAEAAQWQERLEKGTIPGSWRFNPAWFPYWQKAKIQAVFFQGRVREQAAALRVTITSDRGFRAVRQAPVVDGILMTDSPDKLMDIPIPGLPEATYTARGEVLNANGEIVAAEERTYDRIVFPWEGNTLGESRGVIAPWIAMSMQANTVTCWGREHRLSESGFPDQVVSQEKGLLAAPIAIELTRTDGRSLKLRPTGNLSILEQANDRVRWRGQGNLGEDLAVTVTGLAEYDGFSWYAVTITPSNPVHVRSGRVVISLPEREAQLMHVQSCWARNNFSGAIPSGEGVVFKSLDTVNYGRTGGFLPHIWIGNLTRGLSWFADSDEGWNSIADISALEIVRTGNQVQLVMNVLAWPVLLDGPRTFRFGLMATPFKPLMPIRDIPTRAVNWLSFKDGKTVVQASMYGVYPPGFDYSLIGEHIGERRLYFNKHEMGAALPERDVFDNEWGGMEPAPDYPGAPERFGPGIASRAVNRSLTDSRIDMMVWYIAELARKSTMAATYWDITGIGVGFPMLENGTAYVDEITGNVVPTFDLLKSRQLFKRVATVWQEIRGEPDYMEIHSTNHMGMPFYSFAYSWLNFEWLWPNAKARRADGRWQDFIDLRPLDLFATEGVPSQFGVWINSINSGQRPDEPAEHRRIDRSGTALSMLHNHSAPGMGGSGLKAPPSIGRRDALPFIGYWDEDQRIRTSHGLVRASYWHTADRLELVVVNLDLKANTVSLSIPLPSLGWTGATAISDTTGEPEADRMRQTQRYRSSPQLLAELDTAVAQAAADRKPPQISVADGVLTITAEVASHDYRLFLVEGH